MDKERLIVLTGAGGYIGRSLIQRVMDKTTWRVCAFSSSLEFDNNKWGDRVVIRPNEQICSVLPTMKDTDTCVHLAFSRRFKSNSDIALSIDFSSELFKAALSCGCRLINMSTVGVYGVNLVFPDEKTTPAPDSLYSMAKYASEVLMRSFYQNESIDATNLRLSGIAQSQRVLPVFIENAKTKGEIQIVGGKQQFSWIDIDDAVDAIIALIRYDGKWRNAYNVSLNKQRYQIMELAGIVSALAQEKGYGRTLVTVSPSNEIPICVGWNSEAFITDTGWLPQVTIGEIIKKMF